MGHTARPNSVREGPTQGHEKRDSLLTLEGESRALPRDLKGLPDPAVSGQD